MPKPSADRRSEVFVSTTTKDLGPVRDMVTRALLTIGCHPVVQETFPPDYRGVAEMLEDRIAKCDAVIHVVGVRYGEEPDPATLPGGRDRRSYTMMEAEIGRRLSKKVYVFVCPEDFPYDAAHAENPEPPDKQELQAKYRREVLTDNRTLRTEVRDAADLGHRVRELDLELARLSGVIAHDRGRTFRILAALTLALAVLAAGVWWTFVRTPDRKELAEIVGTAVEKAFSADPTKLRDQLRRATETKSSERIAELKAAGAGFETLETVRKERDYQLGEIERTVEAIVRDLAAPDAEPLFVEASRILQDDGVDAALAFLAKRDLEIDSRIDKAKNRRDRTTADLRNMLQIRLLEARTLESGLRYDEAIAVREKVLEADPTWIEPRLELANLLSQQGEVVDPVKGNKWLRRSEQLSRAVLALLPATEDRSTTWAITQISLGNALSLHGPRASGAEGVRLLSEAVDAYRAALEVCTKASLPQKWALTQNNLGMALLDQGERAPGAEGVRLLDEAVEACRAALEVYTKASLPQDWAMTQNNLALALSAKGERASGAEGIRLLGEAVEAYRAALEVRAKASLPQDWAATQNNMGNALRAQGQRATGAEGVRLLGEAVDAYRAALEVYTKASLPQRWATTQNNLGIALSAQGQGTSGAEGVRLLGEAVDAFRAALEVYTKASLPQQWGTTQNNLGNALQRQGDRASVAEGVRLLGEAVNAYRAALEVRIKAKLPQQWAATQNNLGRALLAQGKRASGAEGVRLLGEAVTAFRAALEVYTEAGSPHQWEMVQENLKLALVAREAKSQD